MTLVLPAAAYCSNQTAKNHLFTPLSSGNSSNMPCVFDGEPLDFESALMTDWPTLKDITEYDATSDESAKTTPVSSDRSPTKRKFPLDVNENDNATEPKKPCLREDSSSPSSPASLCSSVSSLSPASSSPVVADTEHAQREIPSAPLSTSPNATEKETSPPPTSLEVDDDEDLFLPRRRVPQMWNSRQRWKDERKKVLKMSIGKLAEIEDPELWLLRSVLINNTIKKLHQDIRLERQAKMRHRQQRIDFYTERFESTLPILPPVHHHRVTPLSNTSTTTTNYHQPSSYYSSPLEEKKPQMVTNSSDLYDETSCDEIFGISEDFLRVTIPDRRVSSPIPTTVQSDCNTTSANTSSSSTAESKDCGSVTPMEVTTTSSCFQSSSSGIHCDTSSDSTRGSFSSSFRRTQSDLASVESPSSRQVGAIIPSLSANVGSPCATQYRTNNHDGAGGGNRGIGGDNAFPPRVPILDSVVYHSLLASLESS